MSSSEACTSIKVLSWLASFSSISVILEAGFGISKGFWREHTYDKNTRWRNGNTRWVARVKKQEYIGLELKHKKGIYRKFPL